MECHADKMAALVGMDPMEFRILNAYRDGDMKAHRREAKNTALIECVQVAAEKAKWPIREEFRRMSSRVGGGGERAAVPATPREGARPTEPAQGRTAYERPPLATPTPVSTPAPVYETLPSREHPPPEPVRPPSSPAPSPPPAVIPHGAPRFSSVFGTRRR
jgi:hypothetical protein